MQYIQYTYTYVHTAMDNKTRSKPCEYLSASVRLHVAMQRTKKLIYQATGKINRRVRAQARAMMSTQRARSASFSFLRYANISMCVYLQHQKAINPPSPNLKQNRSRFYWEWRQCQWRCSSYYDRYRYPKFP